MLPTGETKATQDVVHYVILEIMPKQVLFRKITGFKILCKPYKFASHRCVCNTHRMSQSEKKKGQAAS